MSTTHRREPSADLGRRAFAARGAAFFASIALIPRAVRAAPLNLKYAHDMTVEHPLHTASVQMWDAVRRETGGRLDVKIFPHNELGSDAATLTQVRAGAIDFAQLSGNFLEAIIPVTGIEAVPFAWHGTRDVFSAMDGALGANLRKEMEAKGLHAFARMFDLGFRQVTSAAKPVRTAADLAGFKIRVPPTKIFIDFFKTLGAAPTPLSFPELYVGLQTHVVDGMEQVYSVLETGRFYEVQRYLSTTNHIWTGTWLVAGNDTWKSLPGDVQAVVERNAAKYALVQRRDSERTNAALADKLKRRGMIFVQPDTATLKAQLKPFYKRWRDEFGSTAWDILESKVGKLA